MGGNGILWILCLGQILSAGAMPMSDDEEGSGLKEEFLWNGGEKCEKPCSGESCTEMANLMENLIDLTVDPCQDFFAFACSAKTRGTPLPVTPIDLVDEEALVKSPPEGYEYIKKFYQSCTSISDGFTTEEVFEDCVRDDGKCTEREVEEYGDIYVQFLRYTEDFFKMTLFPAVNPNWEEDSKDWFEGFGWTWWDVSALVLKDNFYLAAFHDEARDTFRSNVFFAPLINRNGFDTTHMIHIVPMTLPRRFRDKDFLKKYEPLVKGLLASFGAAPSTIGNDTARILEMEQQLVDIGLPDSFNDFSESLTIRELANLVPSVPWKDYIESTLSHKEGFKVKPSTTVKVPNERMMRKLGEMLEELTPRDTANLMIWRMFIRFVNDFMKTGADNDDLQQDPFAEHCDLGSHSSRKENCLCQINTLFPEAFDDMLIGKYITKKKKEGIKEIFKNMAEEFEEVIDEQDWMSRRTKITAKEKVQNMGINVGEQSPNSTEFALLKDKMNRKDYINNILAIGNYKYDTLVKQVDEEVKAPRRRGEEVQNNAFYSPSRNEMLIKTGLITGFFGKGLSFELPRSIIYGGHGSTTLGHEMVHGFDNNGKAYDKDGFKLNWWSKKEEKDYANRTKCLSEQYRSFTINYKGEPFTLSGVHDQGENIADNGGAKAAYRAYKKLPSSEKECVPGFNLTSDQLFWVGHAFDWCTLSGRDTSYQSILRRRSSGAGHSPGPWRVNVPFANLPQFAEDFKCKKGSNLKPEKRCTIW